MAACGDVTGGHRHTAFNRGLLLFQDMADTMQNQIPARQNEDAQVKLLRARTRTYSIANRFMVLQLCLTVLIPVLGSLCGVINPQVRPYFTLLALIVLLVDPLWIDRLYKENMKRAAKIAEQFDCTVLEIGWNSFVVGDQVEAEDIHRAAIKYRSSHDDSQLTGWYPKTAGDIPLHLARFVCQRTNLRYDSQLRRHYASMLAGLAVFIAAVVVMLGIAQQLTLQDWVLNFALLSPLLSWSVREFYRQRDTADQQQDLMKSAKKLWERCLEGDCTEDEASFRAREIQDAIYARRVSSPLMIPLIYKFRRPGLEDEMNESANNFLVQYLQRAAAKK